jgi:ribosomal protein S18 acetylase RimI-like enzyme
MNQSILNEFVLNLKKVKYRNKIQDLKLEYCHDDEEHPTPYIYLALIKVKKSCREQGIGHSIMSDLVALADSHNVQIRLWPTNIYGADLQRLLGFYKRHGFVIIKDYYETTMEYYPNVQKKKIALSNIKTPLSEIQ